MGSVLSPFGYGKELFACSSPFLSGEFVEFIVVLFLTSLSLLTKGWTTSDAVRLPYLFRAERLPFLSAVSPLTTSVNAICILATLFYTLWCSTFAV